MLHAPYVDSNGELQYAGVTITQHPKVCKRKAKFVLRKWYEKAGINMPNTIFEKVWKTRYVTPAMTTERVNNLINDITRGSNEEIKKESDSEDEGAVAKEAIE